MSEVPEVSFWPMEMNRNAVPHPSNHISEENVVP